MKIKLRKLMRSVPQNESQDLLQHGFSVARFFKDLRDYVQFGSSLKYQWKMPSWIFDPVLLDSLPDIKDIYQYQIYHDIGKTVTRSLNPDGRSSFPNHAFHSRRLWLKIGGDELVGEMMFHDMDIHLMSASETENFSKLVFQVPWY